MTQKDIKGYLIDNYRIDEASAENMARQIARKIDYSVMYDQIDCIAEIEGLKKPAN